MRIIKNTQNDIDSIVGEMINTTYGMTIYKDGILLDNFKKNHNEYTINDVSYNIHPNIGILYLLSDKDINLNTITNKFYIMTGKLLGKIDISTIEVGSADTRNNLLIIDNNKNPYTSVGFEFNKLANQFWKTPLLTKFTWCIYDRNYVDQLPILNWSMCKSRNNILSLSTIIYDDLNLFKLENCYKSPDYPSIKDCVMYNADKIYDKTIYYNLESGPLLEIVNHYISLDKYNINNSFKVCYYNNYNKIKDNLHYAKWDQLVIYENNNELIPWYKQIEYGLLESEKFNNKTIKDNDYTQNTSTQNASTQNASTQNASTQNTSTQNTSTSNNKIYKCFITGIPIYEDCYVFDICSINTDEIIDIRDLHKYPNAKIISDLGNNINTEETKIKSNKKITKPKKSTGSKNSTRPRKDKRSANDQSTNTLVQEIKIQEIKIQEIKIQEIKIQESKTQEYNNDADENQYEETQLEEKQLEEKIQYVKINYTHVFTTPKCILISPWYMHFIISNNFKKEPIVNFETITKTKILIYRTYCPTTSTQVIESLNTTPLHKKILNELDTQISAKANTVLTNSYNFKNDIATTDLLFSNNKIYVRGKECRY